MNSRSLLFSSTSTLRSRSTSTLRLRSTLRLKSTLRSRSTSTLRFSFNNYQLLTIIYYLLSINSYLSTIISQLLSLNSTLVSPALPLCVALPPRCSHRWWRNSYGNTQGFRMHHHPLWPHDPLPADTSQSRLSC